MEGSLNVWGLVAVIAFYVAILLIGVYASYRKKSISSQKTEDVMLAGRDIGLLVGIFTMTGGNLILAPRHPVCTYRGSDNDWNQNCKP